ncbi:DUF4352 domain-containing protein [Streptomyces sp. NPDC004838]
MRHMASALLLSALALGTTACQSAADAFGGRSAPRAAEASRAVLDHKGSAEEPAWVGDTVELDGRTFGEHLRVSVRSSVDPAVALRPAKGTAPRPRAGTRWFGVDVTVVNVGGRTFDAGGTRTWVADEKGKRYPAVKSGEITTGLALEWNSLAVGDPVQGWLVFEVPENTRIVRFHSSLGKATATWQLQGHPSR